MRKIMLLLPTLLMCFALSVTAQSNNDSPATRDPRQTSSAPSGRPAMAPSMNSSSQSSKSNSSSTSPRYNSSNSSSSSRPSQSANSSSSSSSSSNSTIQRDTRSPQNNMQARPKND